MSYAMALGPSLDLLPELYIALNWSTDDMAADGFLHGLHLALSASSANIAPAFAWLARRLHREAAGTKEPPLSGSNAVPYRSHRRDLRRGTELHPSRGHREADPQVPP